MKIQKVHEETFTLEPGETKCIGIPLPEGVSLPPGGRFVLAASSGFKCPACNRQDTKHIFRDLLMNWLFTGKWIIHHCPLCKALFKAKRNKSLKGDKLRFEYNRVEVLDD